MCDRCEIDMLMHGEPIEHEAPVWEKGRFQAKAVEPTGDGEAADASFPRRKRPETPDDGREQE